jgi:glycosyltransferase involved in cell wall biosynthesis
MSRASTGTNVPPREDSRNSVTVIIPFHRRLSQLSESLRAARDSMPDAEILIAADGAREDCRPLAESLKARVIEIRGPLGPAVARNRAAAEAQGAILVFIDTDVVVAPDAVPRLCALLDREPEVAAVFGAYDEAPRERNFSSRYRNLSHSYIHQIASREATTFWAGLGAVRAAAFRAVGGFSEDFPRPSVEDIELGYRLLEAGFTLRVEPAARGCHLKRWTLTGGVVSDIRDRGVPWVQLILGRRAMPNDLNTSTGLRWSVVLSYLLLAGLIATIVRPSLWWAPAGALAALVAINWRYYRWFAAREGVWFAVRVVAVHTLHHLSNGISLATGAAIYFAGRRKPAPPLAQ